MMTERWRNPLLTALLGLLLAGPAAAEPLASDWGKAEHAEARLLAAPAADGKVTLALEIRLAEGWKTYWRSPGDAGLPPVLDWAGSRNLAPGAIAWPAPLRFSFAGLETFGYEGDVVLPIAARRPDRAAPASARLSVDFLTCGRLCVPARVTLALDLSAAAGPGPWAGPIAQALARVPVDGPGDGIAVERAAVAAEGADGVLSVRLVARPPLGQPDLLVEGAGGIAFDRPEPAADGLRLRAPGAAAALLKLRGAPLQVTVIDRAAPAPRAATIPVTVARE